MSNTFETSSEDSVWTATLATLSMQHPAVQACVYRLATVHWFDDQLIKALVDASPWPALVDDPEMTALPLDLMTAVVESQPFVEPEGEGRHRLHAEVRQSVLRNLLRLEPNFVSANESAAIDELTRRAEPDSAGVDPDELIELAYLLLAHSPSDPGLAEQLFAGANTSITLATLDRLMTYVIELDHDGRLQEESKERLQLWTVWVASAAADYPRVVKLAEEALRTAPPGSDLSDDLIYQLALGRSQLGELKQAGQLLTELIARRQGTYLGALATMLSGDIATSPDDAKLAYLDALDALIEVHAPDSGHDPGRHDPDRWLLVDEIDADGDVIGPAIGVYDEQAFLPLPADPTLAELWMRIADTDSRRGRLGVATGWLQIADEFFRAIGDTDSALRVWDQQQAIRLRSGNATDLSELEARYEERLAWARFAHADTLEMRVLFDIASARRDANDADAAEERLAEAAEIANRIDDAFAIASIAETRAGIASMQGRLDDAERHLNEARAGYQQTDPSGVFRLELSVADLALARLDESAARDAYQRLADWAAAENQPDDEARARMGLARLAETDYNLPTASSEIQRAAALGDQLDPVLELDVLIQQARVLRLSRRDEEATELESRIERRAEELSRPTTIAWLVDGRARTASRRGHHAEAVRLHREALRIFEEIEDRDGIFYSIVGLSWNLPDAGNLDEALETAERATRLAEESRLPAYIDAALRNLGSALTYAKRYDEAIATLLEAGQVNGPDSLLCIALSWTCLRAGRFDDSMTWARKSLELRPSDLYAYRSLGHALLCLGRTDEAFTAYRQAIEGRFGDDHFNNTIDELNWLARTFPSTPGLSEAKALFEEAQSALSSLNMEQRS